jgi:hypothetical protein
MKIVPIFADEDCLLSAHYASEDSDEFNRIFDEWTDIEFLYGFFKINETDLNRDSWKGISIQDAILETQKEASQFRKLFIELSEKEPNTRIKTFEKLFKPLGGRDTNPDYLEKKKVYGIKKSTWLRIYALKVCDDMYIITGGAIKLTDNMDERAHTQKELQKLDICKQYLRSKGIIDEDGMTELLECGDYE